MTKTACFIPIKDNSTRVSKKNTRLFGNKSLFRYVVDTVIKSNKFDDIFVDTDSDEVKIQKITAIHGMAKKTALRFVEAIPQFVEWMKDAQLTNIDLVYKSKKVFSSFVIGK